MIIDLILDRKEGVPYSPRKFYREVMEYGDVGEGIASALDYGEEADVKRELVSYVIENGYNPDIAGYINGKEWLTN